ncbi:MAG: hypothetical protein GX890_05110 [Firmicutes bacterium]|jgi:hypothetical protein|nr:hypothetical protein [Bacillota bacterium]HPU01194.1 hypothetical protein [Bacillota bacterium]
MEALPPAVQAYEVDPAAAGNLILSYSFGLENSRIAGRAGRQEKAQAYLSFRNFPI